MSNPSEFALTAEERRTISSLHAQTKELVFQIGQLSIRKDALTQNFRFLSEQAQAQIDAAGVRMGIPQGTPWQMMPDGSVVLLDPATGQPK